jgi:hypothetical protein
MDDRRRRPDAMDALVGFSETTKLVGPPPPLLVAPEKVCVHVSRPPMPPPVVAAANVSRSLPFTVAVLNGALISHVILFVVLVPSICPEN